MELLTDVATALQAVAKDYLPVQRFSVFLTTEPRGVVLQIPGATSPDAEAALYELAAASKATTDRALPSLPLTYRVIGGSEAAGIEIRAASAVKPTYGHIIKASLAWLSPSALMRRQRPNLPERINI